MLFIYFYLFRYNDKEGQNRLLACTEHTRNNNYSLIRSDCLWSTGCQEDDFCLASYVEFDRQQIILNDMMTNVTGLRRTMSAYWVYEAALGLHCGNTNHQQKPLQRIQSDNSSPESRMQ